MTTRFKKANTINSIQETSINEGTFVKRGYVVSGPSTQKGEILLEGTPNIAVGGVYNKGNISRSFVNLSNIGTYIGNLSLEDSPEQNLNLVVYNYLNSLIPGQYPEISGPWKENQLYYNLQEILDYTNENENRYFCKILGLGLGNINNYRVADSCRNALSMLSQNVDFGTDDQGFAETYGIKQTDFSNVLDGYIYPFTQTGSNFYMEGFDWAKRYGITVINGTNTFPTMGWAGARIGSIKPVSFQFQQNALYNFPSSYLELSKSYNPLGLIYSGQGVQLTSYPTKSVENIISFEERNIRTFQEVINNRINERKYTGIQPYQQGRGTYELFSNEVTYNQVNGLVNNVVPIALYGSEGVQPGRNNAFIGVALSDYWSDNLNLNNVESGSTTPDDTRYKIKGIEQTKTAHNAPLVYSSNDKNNTFNPLPWNSLYAYIGSTTSSSSNKRSQNTPIMNEGISTMVVSGAYPVYRAAWSSEYSGFGDPTDGIRNLSQGYNNYVTTEEFWNPDFIDPATPEIADIGENPPIPPNPPYRIKGGRIWLYEGQRVNAGSYVYSSMNQVGNVNMSQFYGPAAKDIVLNQGERDQLLGDVYSKFQSNQGGLIVMVSIDGRPPPIPPPCCQPVGVILEDIVGFGTPETIDGQLKFENNNENIQENIVFNSSEVKNIQGRGILVKLVPMYPNMNLTGFPGIAFNIFIFYIGIPYTTGTTSGSNRNITPFYNKIKTSYMLSNIDASGNSALAGTSQFTANNLKLREFINDGPNTAIPFTIGP